MDLPPNCFGVNKLAWNNFGDPGPFNGQAKADKFE
jgi:hypothetical protein